MGEDQPIIVGGGPNMITVQVRDCSAGSRQRTFSVAPEDPAVPFKEIVVTDGTNEIFRWSLSEEWKIAIV
jgi:hypothetical protein